MNCTHQILLGHQTKDDEMGGDCDSYGAEQNRKGTTWKA